MKKSLTIVLLTSILSLSSVQNVQAHPYHRGGDGYGGVVGGVLGGVAAGAITAAILDANKTTVVYPVTTTYVQTIPTQTVYEQVPTTIQTVIPQPIQIPLTIVSKHTYTYIDRFGYRHSVIRFIYNDGTYKDVQRY